MTRRWIRRGSIAILLFISILFLTSCVVVSPLINVRPSSPVIVIDVPPNRLSISGLMDKKDFVYLHNYLDMLLDEDYHKHHYKYPSGIKVDFNTNTKQVTKFESKVNIK